MVLRVIGDPVSANRAAPLDMIMIIITIIIVIMFIITISSSTTNSIAIIVIIIMMTTRVWRIFKSRSSAFVAQGHPRGRQIATPNLSTKIIPAKIR